MSMWGLDAKDFNRAKNAGKQIVIEEVVWRRCVSVKEVKGLRDKIESLNCSRSIGGLGRFGSGGAGVVRGHVLDLIDEVLRRSEK